MTTNPKDLIGSLKVPLHLLPATAEVQGAMAMNDGAKKYGPYNWRESAVQASIYVAAARRHLMAWFDASQETAADSGVHHLGHVIACCAIILDAQLNGVLVDDRPKPGNIVELLDQMSAHLKTLAAVSTPLPPRRAQLCVGTTTTAESERDKI